MVRIRFHFRPVRALLLGALLVVGCSSSPTAPPPPVDPFPTGPGISCPSPVSITSPNNQPTIVVYGAPTPSGGAPPVNVSCSQASQTLFPIGTTTVTCTATDARQRTGSCTFAVTVVAPPTITVTRYVAFGDSITSGEDGNALAFSTPSSSDRLRPTVFFPPSKTYPGVLQQTLTSRYTTQQFSVANEGAPGEQANPADTRARFGRVVGSGLYDVVLIMEGTNDVSQRNAQIADAAIDSLRLMVRDAGRRRVRPYLATIPPQVPGGFRSSLTWALVPPFNDRIRVVAASEGVTLADVYAGLVTNTGLYINSDGEHLTEQGYAEVANVFFLALKSTLERPPTLSFSPSGAGWFYRRR